MAAYELFGDRPPRFGNRSEKTPLNSKIPLGAETANLE